MTRLDGAVYCKVRQVLRQGLLDLHVILEGG